MTQGRQRRFVRAMALLVLLGAILPNVAYLGHWTIRGLQITTAEAADESHANHCHGASSCANQAVGGLEWSFRDEESLILDGGPQRALDPGQTPSPSDPVVAPLDPPPRYA